METISVVMTTYNGEKYIIEQLDSIFSQTIVPNQVIIADDCSKDNTKDLIEKYLQSIDMNIAVAFYSNQINQGYIKNFRNAILKTTGDYIFLCDQDDIWEKNKIEFTLAEMHKRKKDVACTGFRLVDAQGQEIKNTDIYRSDPIFGYEKWTKKVYDVTLSRLLWGNFSPGCTYCFSRKIRNIYKQLSNTEISHDFQIILIGACLHSAIFIDIPLSCYRLHSSNTIGMNSKEKKRKRHFTPRLISFINELKLYCMVDVKIWEKCALYARVPKIRSVFVHKFNLNNYIKFRK